MSSSDLKYIVYAPSFDEDSGGAIFMHELVHTLNSMGEEAYLWPLGRDVSGTSILQRIRRWVSSGTYKLNTELTTPIAQLSDLNHNMIVVYPEIVPGNPLGAKNVVRWLLYRPGELSPYLFGEGEMFFRVFKKADIPELTGGATDLFLWKVNRTYRNENRPNRKGVCYTVRKGGKKARILETENAETTLIDGLSHTEINNIFNNCEVFYSYDEATMYSQFAAICGCLSIVIPGEHANRKEWEQNHDLGRYGVAYGTQEAELNHARATQSKLLELLEEKEKAGIETVKRFVTLSKERSLK